MKESHTLERALTGQPEPGVGVLWGAPPPLLDGRTSQALTTPLMAAFMISAATLRGRLDTQAFDVLALGLNALAVAFAARSILEWARLISRLWAQRHARQHALAFGPEVLLWRSPGGDRRVARHQVAAVVSQPARLPGRPKQRARPVWLALWPEYGSTHITLPPYFAQDSEVLVARLTRWLDRDPAPCDSNRPRKAAPAQLETALRQAEAGQASPEVAVVRSARNYLRRAPFGFWLVTLLAIDTWRVLPGEVRPLLALPLTALGALAACAPALWWLVMRRRTYAQHGLKLLWSSEQVAGLSPSGAVVLAYRKLASAEVDYRARWSPFLGGYAVRTLQLSGHDGTQLRYDADLLDAPAEVLAALAEALAERSPQAA